MTKAVLTNTMGSVQQNSEMNKDSDEGENDSGKDIVDI